MTSTKIPLPTHLQSCQDVPGHGGGQLPNIFKGTVENKFPDVISVMTFFGQLWELPLLPEAAVTYYFHT